MQRSTTSLRIQGGPKSNFTWARKLDGCSYFSRLPGGISRDKPEIRKINVGR